MSTLQGFPARGSDVALVISKVHLHPLCVLVEFWGRFFQERTPDYTSLSKDIQSAGNRFQEFEGKHGDQCLVRIDGTWYRGRVVSRNDAKYSVFLVDRGMTYSTVAANLAWGKSAYFQLPPEVEFCVLANTLPLSSDNRWSPLALEFLRCLAGKSVNARVQDVFPEHRMFLLDVPSVSKQMCELGFARKLSPEAFRNFVLMSLQPQSGVPGIPEAEGALSEAIGSLHQRDVFLYPEISAGSVETVEVTHVISPQRLFCQLKVFSKELQKLSERLSLCCEGKPSRCSITPEMIGFPCATRGSDGKWRRSVLQQVFPNGTVVEVLNVDCGSKECVQVENVRPLGAEFFRMPVVTYICSLYGIADNCVGWTSGQIDYLKSLLLNKTVIARFEYQNVCEGVYFVTLHGEENVNLNNLFGSRKSYSLEDPDSGPPPQKDRKQPIWEGRDTSGGAETLPCEDLPLNASQPATVQHVSGPSEFWIQTFNCSEELDELMERLNRLCKDSPSGRLASPPAVGLYCAARAEDGDFYRARVAEVVGEKQARVFFLDYGNVELVPGSSIRVLPQEFKALPCLALRCSLAGVKPRGAAWSQRAVEYFRHAVLDATVDVHVVAKRDGGFVVRLAKDQSDVGALMCRAGLAEKAEPRGRSGESREGGSGDGALPPAAAALAMPVLPVGSVLDVAVSHVESPSRFWCQLVQNTGELKALMRNIQEYYRSSGVQPVAGAACVARCPGDGMWYRALIVHRPPTPHVRAVLVDYGHTETIPICDLRNVAPEFLTLPVQALRCSLLNPLDPMAFAADWTPEATARFRSSVEAAESDFAALKCTVYALVRNEESQVFHVADLETPFHSISNSMVSLFKSAIPKKRASLSLDTYFYSTHSIKVGAEEQMTVTCVDGVGRFFCQPSRNADVIMKLKLKLNNLCQQLDSRSFPAVPGTLCFARYSDGQWYRGQVKAAFPAVLVHFVDYGDTIEVEKSDLIPVPKRLNDIMSVPAQAVMCGLSDVPVDVPKKVNRWFRSAVTERTFRAVIVARESDGKLLVELYRDKTQINSQLKRTFQIEAPADEHLVHPEAASGTRLENIQKIKAAPKELYQPPHQRASHPTAGLLAESGSADSKGRSSGKLPKLGELPPKCIQVGLEADVYVSHCDGPASFHVQLVREEVELVSMVTELNDLVSSPQVDVGRVEPGDLVRAEFADDSSWYRAVVRKTVGTAAVVEFVDFGNEATTPISKMGKLGEHFLQVPVFSVHCRLQGVPEGMLDPEAAAAFKEKCGNAEKVLRCRFLRQRGSVWEVSLGDSRLGNVSKSPSEVPESSPDTPQRYSQREFLVGETLQVCVSSVNEDQTFWCLAVDDLDRITSAILDICNAPGRKSVDPDAISAGSPCLALFPADGLWYRAEVRERDGDRLRVFFVDYGNTSTVGVADVRELPPGLVATPPLAFLCELECSDASRGSWDADELSELMTDQVLQLTVAGVSRKDGKIKCSVRMEADGRDVNETLERKWRSATSDPAATGPDPQGEAPLRDEPTSKESLRAEHRERPETLERDGGGVENGGEPDPQTGPPNFPSPGEHLLESLEEDMKDEMMENQRESSPDGPPVDLWPADGEDQVVDDQSDESSSCDRTTPEAPDSSDASTLGTIEEEDLNVLLEENPPEDADNSEIDLICLHVDDSSCSCFETSADSERNSACLFPLWNLLLVLM